MEKLDSEISAFLSTLHGAGLPSDIGVRAARDDMRERAGRIQSEFGAPVVRQVRDLPVPGSKGQLAARMYIPQVRRSRSIMLFFHSGGHVIGDLDTGDPVARSLCKGVGCDVLSVSYGLAPENKFPADIADAVAVTIAADRDLVASGKYESLLVAGDSAGATIAAAVANQTIGLMSQPIALQVLLYGAFDVTKRFASELHATDDPFLNLTQLAWFESQYLEHDSDHFDPRASPALYPNLEGLPPAVIATVEMDPLRDQGVRYADLLAAASVGVSDLRFTGLPHGFMEFETVSERAASAIGVVCAAIAESLSRGSDSVVD